MRVSYDPVVLCPVCGGPAKDLELFVDTSTGAFSEQSQPEVCGYDPITIRACESIDCDAYHPAARRYF
jgi:hypothetical protein